MQTAFTRVEMEKKWSDEDIEAAIAVTLSQLGYLMVRRKQLEAVRVHEGARCLHFGSDWQWEVIRLQMPASWL